MNPASSVAPTGSPRRTIASYEPYAKAEAAVDRLSDRKFPVEHVAIIASDLRFVERVTGRLNAGRAALASAGTGALLGAGLLLRALQLGRSADLRARAGPLRRRPRSGRRGRGGPRRAACHPGAATSRPCRRWKPGGYVLVVEEGVADDALRVLQSGQQN